MVMDWDSLVHLPQDVIVHGIAEDHLLIALDMVNDQKFISEDQSQLAVGAIKAILFLIADMDGVGRYWWPKNPQHLYGLPAFFGRVGQLGWGIVHRVSIAQEGLVQVGLGKKDQFLLPVHLELGLAISLTRQLGSFGHTCLTGSQPGHLLADDTGQVKILGHKLGRRGLASTASQQHERQNDSCAPTMATNKMDLVLHLGKIRQMSRIYPLAFIKLCARQD
jgi:hypothetical protein